MEVFTVSNKIKKIDILDIIDIIQCTGSELEFKGADLPVDPNIYRYCSLVVDGERIPIVDDFRAIWFKIKEDLQELNISKVSPN